jgi:hypothetical protein
MWVVKTRLTRAEGGREADRIDETLNLNLYIKYKSIKVYNKDIILL